MDLLRESNEAFSSSTIEEMKSKIRYEKIDRRNKNHQYYWVLKRSFDDASATYAFGHPDDRDEDWGNAIDQAVIALSEDKLVGIWKYYKEGKSIYSAGTWTHPEYRKLGIAKTLWSKILLTQKVTSVKVDVATDRGRTLVDTLAKQYPKIKFETEELSGRKLRNLKNAKSR